MSIATRISSIEEHLKESYQELEGIGIDTTRVNNNLENIPKLLDGYWETLPKVTDEGTSITLDNTKEGKMKVLLKGNTYQDSTTGKNILNFKDYLTTNGATFTENSDGSITLTTTQALYDNPYVFSDTDINVSLSGIVTEGTATNARVQLLNSNGTSQGTIYSGVNTLVNKNANKLRLNWSAGGTVTIKKLMLEKGASVTDYEPYTNGPSPNPSYPQNIEVVSGDNKVEVCGKNLFNKNTYNTSTSYAYSNKLLSTDQIMIMSFKDKDTSIDISSLNIGFVIYDGVTSPTYYKWIIRNGEIREDTTNISSQDSNVYCMQWFAYPNNAIETLTKRYDIQIEKGSQATTYEPYVSSSYQVNLPVENLFNINGNINTQYNGNTITSNSVVDGNLVTTTNGGSFHPGGQKIYVGAGNTVTASMIFKNIAYSTQPSSDTIVAYIGFYNDNTITGRNLMNLRQNSIGTKITITFTPTTDYVYLVFARSSVVTSATFGEIQLEVGDKASSFSPYGTTPIELCKIGTYQDRFIRNKGKNKFNVNATHTDMSGVTYKYEYTLKPNTQYTISSNVPNSNTANVYANGTSSGTNKVCLNTPKTITSDSNGYFYIAVRYTPVSGDSGTINMYQAILDGRYWVQIEEGSSATDYEPYGTGDWYLKKETGKVVLDGETDGLKFTSAEISRNKRFSLILNDVLKQSYLLNIDNKSNYFTYNTDVYRDGGDEIGFIINSTQLYVRFGSSSVLDTITKANAWLSTHNTTFYYILATQTYTKIEGTLASQLEALNGSKSYTPQTNISQNNNDMASVLNATALSNGTVTPSLQGVQTLSLGQNVDLQTQEPTEETIEEVEEQGEEL